MNQRQEQEQDDSFQNKKIFSRQVKQKNFNSL